MPRKKRTRDRPELLTRLIEIKDVRASALVDITRMPRSDPEVSARATLELTGHMNEPVRDTRNIEIVLYGADETTVGTKPTPWIGLVLGIKPALCPAIFMAHRDFDRVWALALSGLLKHARIVLTQPQYRKAYVVSISFSTHPEEEP